MKKTSELINELTLEEKASLLSGHKSWFTNSIKRLEIPRITLTDGPHGLRKRKVDSKSIGLGETEISTCFPAASTSGNSWNLNLLNKMGHVIGKECRYYDVDVILGPAVNIKRNPLCGRNFEYFSEDPFITGKMGSALTRGIEEEGVGTSVKHFACNNNEENRYVGDSIIDNRALYEIYLKGFEYIVKEAKPKTIMCAYNKVNGVFASENEELLTNILREKWRFNGVVMSDWGAVNDRVLGVKAGLDLEMPGDIAHNRQVIVNAVKSGELSVNELDKAVLNVLNLIKNRDNFKRLTEIDFDKHSDVAYEVSVESSVLLKNIDNILPLSNNKKYLVIGQLFEKMRYQGAGSSLINPYKIVTPMDAFDKNNIDYLYLRGYDVDSSLEDSNLVKEIDNVINDYDTVLFFGGLCEYAESEGFDRKDMKLPQNQLDIIDKIIDNKKKLVFVYYGGSPIEVPFINDVDAMLAMYLPGQMGGDSTHDLLFGKVSPSGRLTETWPICLDDVCFGKEFTKTNNDIYKESIFVGYRYYNSFKQEVRFPFGYGLSYSNFEYSNLNISQDDLNLYINVDVENVGNVLAKEVIQLYVNAPTSEIIKPNRELKGFDKVSLYPNEKKTIEIIVSKESLCYYLDNNWVLEDGFYDFEICRNVNDLIISKTIKIDSKYDYKIDEIYYRLYSDLDSFKNISDEDFEKIIGRKIIYKNYKKPYDLNTPISEFKSFFGKIIYKAILFAFKRAWIKAKKARESIDKETKIKNAYFTYRVMPYLSLRAMSFTSEGLLSYRMAVGILDIVNGHFFKGLYKILTKERCFELPEGEENE